MPEARPTRVTFCGSANAFRTSKDAYLWLIGRLLVARPDLLEIESEKPYINTGKGRRHFARSPEKLYEKSPHLAEMRDHYVELPGGWFANVHLNNKEKLQILEPLSKAAGLVPNRDWTWDDAEKRLDLTQE